MDLGIDLGTSSLKAILLDDSQKVVAESSAPLALSHPRPRWSEQDPESWWQACLEALHALRAEAPRAFSAVRSIGLSGQMHGATLLDEADRVLRPAILWNDGRSGPQCAELERRVPSLHTVTGNLAMPGFTAPKLLWVREHEPDVFRRTRRVLLPKDYLRLRLTGEYASDLSDSAGTLWLDVGARRWSAEVLAACDLDERAMPSLHEGSAPTGTLRSEAAEALGLSERVVVAAGGGDNAASAVGLGVTRPGQAFLSLGTSGVYFVADARFAPNVGGAVHSFCHCLPERWHRMSVILSAASCLSWAARLLGDSEAELLKHIETDSSGPGEILFLPYLSGERTPHNDPYAKGIFFGLTHDSDRAAVGRAVLEGVAFALADGQRALETADTTIGDVTVTGGGARSRLWGRILASVLGRPLCYREGGELGAAFGAARLGRLAATGESIDAVCEPLPVVETIEPVSEWTSAYATQLSRYRELYTRLSDLFGKGE